MQVCTNDPRMTLKAFTKLVRREVKIYAHGQQLYRAKRKALDQIHSDTKQQYHKLKKYYCFILEKNLGFIRGCRPIIGLDACFLKGPFGGQLMAAIGKDGNNQMFPLVVAVVECEYKPKSNILSNNLIDDSNNYIKEAREEPILSLLEMLRRQFMCRLHKKRDWITTYSGSICLRIQEKLDQIKKNALNFEAFCVGAGTWEILPSSNIKVTIDWFLGRPKKFRKKGADEINIRGRVTKRGSTMTCSKCGKSDHYIRTCKNPPQQSRVIVAAKGSRGHTDVGRVKGTTANTGGGRRAIATASRGTTTTTSKGATTITTAGTVATGRGRGKVGGRGKGPLSSIGNWNGIVMSTMQHFIPANETPYSGPTLATETFIGSSQASITNMQIRRQSTRLGDAMFPAKHHPTTSQ
ncbi:hypothetical protein Sango_0658400 [Sesamum angolense]|uniref:CCHC-type domain-containing protein n=1 Tax=Sesamum angolense TaxID=2727404 RepID=A0AAE2C2C8_9LAMI|nr:hypothetical protein Sango_0658400 [Sesamum angolense]